MSDGLWKVPTSWAWAKAGEVGEIVGGGTPPAGDPANFDVDGTPWLTPADLSDFGDTYIARGRRSLSAVGLSSSSARVLPKGAVLFSSRAPIGYCVIAANPISTNQGFKSLILKPTVLPEYVRHYLLASVEYIEGMASGTTFKEISGSRMGEVLIPLPPLPEQRRIVARIEALFARTRRTRADLERIAPLAQKSRIAVLASAFRGDLTRDLRHGSDLSEADGPWPIPTSWAWRRVDDVGHVGLGRQRSPVNHNGPFMRPYMRAANITWGGWDFSDVKEMNFAEPDFSRFRLERGDVLLNEGSGSAREVGKPAIWRGEIANCCFQNTLLRVQPRQCTTDYLYFYFLEAALSGRFAAETQGVNIHHIGKERLASLPIPVPPSHEQVAVAQRLKAVLNRPAQAEREATRALALLDRLEQSFLTRGFRGELVPQDPNDEPASILLERIKAGGEAEDEKLTSKRRRQPNRAKENSMKDRPLPARDQLLKDSEKWPKTGLPFEAIAKRVFMPHDTLRDALFELLSGPSPALQQRFDSEGEAMVIQRVAA